MAVRFGVIGVGAWARQVHMANLLDIEGAHVRAVCSRSEENRGAGAALCRTPPLLFEKLEDMLACDEVDAVIICTPNALHAQQCIQALRAGKHVLCEKPLALRREDAAQVAQVAKESDRVLAMGHELRSADVTVAAAQAVQGGKVGHPLMITGRLFRSWGPFKSGWRGDASLSGGIFFELFCHLSDFEAGLVGEWPTSVSACAGAVDGAPYWDRASVTFCFPSGTLGVGDLCMYATGAGLEYPFEVMGPEGRLVGDVVEGRLSLWLHGAAAPLDLSPQRDPAAETRGFPGTMEMLREFVDCIVGRRAVPRATVEDGVLAVATALAIHESIERGQVVLLQGSRK